MSASLVGSEMCIRDSLRGHSKGTPVRRAASKTQSEIRNSLIRKSMIPVSYTHLTLPTICSV
eukprot:10753272-Alexandrium_andersonii.AAC.1